MRPIANALPGALTELLRGAPLSAGKVNVAWCAAVGTGINRQSSVRLDGQLLIVEAANGQWAREITRLSDVALARLQTLLGPDTVTRLEVRTKRA